MLQWKQVVFLFCVFCLLMSCIPVSTSEQIEDFGGLIEDNTRDIALLKQISPVGNYGDYLAGREQLPFSLAEKSPPLGGASLVVIFVESSLMSNLSAEIALYNATLRMFAFDTVIYEVSGGTAEDLKNQIVTLWNNGYLVVGSVLIGDLPCEWFHHENDFYGAAEFPCDLFLMDLDGTWSDTDNDGMYDLHVDGAGDTAPEIYVGRIDASKVPGNEVMILKKYFTKVQNFWSGQINQTKVGLTYTDYDWAGYSSFRHDIGYAFEEYEAVWYPDVWRDDYVYNRIPGSYEFVQLSCHSSSSGHVFHSGGWAMNYDIRNAPPMALFYNLFCCSSLRFTDYNCLGNAYIMDTNTSSLSVVGSAKTGSMLDFQYFYEPIGNGASFGTALKEWFEWEHPYTDGDISWFYGMTILGDPTLIIHCPKNFPPSGSEISGPEIGATGREYCFGIEVFDEEDDGIYCRWSWGDGAVSEWMGAYSSGDILNVSHQWEEVGTYQIRVQLKDERGSETGWLYPKTIDILQAPTVMIKNIQGGLLRLSTTVKNDGAFAAENVNWRISVDGGLIVLGRESTGVIDAIEPGDEIDIGSRPILGVGKTRVFVEVSCKDSMDLRDQKAIMLFFYLYVNPGGG